MNRQLGKNFYVTRGSDTSLGLILDWPFIAKAVGSSFWNQFVAVSFLLKNSRSVKTIES